MFTMLFVFVSRKTPTNRNKPTRQTATRTETRDGNRKTAT
jgi:hypothetical protein